MDIIKRVLAVPLTIIFVLDIFSVLLPHKEYDNEITGEFYNDIVNGKSED